MGLWATYILFAVCKVSQCPTVEWHESELFLFSFFFFCFFCERADVGPISNPSPALRYGRHVRQTLLSPLLSLLVLISPNMYCFSDLFYFCFSFSVYTINMWKSIKYIFKFKIKCGSLGVTFVIGTISLLFRFLLFYDFIYIVFFLFFYLLIAKKLTFFSSPSNKER